MTETCLWCESDKEARKVEKGKDFICGSCVVMLMGFPQEALNKTYHKCLRLGLTRKAPERRKVRRKPKTQGNGHGAENGR